MKWTLIEGAEPNVLIGTFYPPKETPYYDGILFAHIIVPNGFPMHPPSVIMRSRIFHPNFRETGELYINMLYEGWDGRYTLDDVMNHVWHLLIEPDMDPLSQNNIAASELYKNNRREFNKKARKWTLKYCR